MQCLYLCAFHDPARSVALNRVEVASLLMRLSRLLGIVRFLLAHSRSFGLPLRGPESLSSGAVTFRVKRTREARNIRQMDQCVRGSLYARKCSCRCVHEDAWHSQV